MRAAQRRYLHPAVYATSLGMRRSYAARVLNAKRTRARRRIGDGMFAINFIDTFCLSQNRPDNFSAHVREAEVAALELVG